MSRSLLIFTSFIALSACTQPPAMVDLRGQEYFGQHANRNMMASRSVRPSAPVRYQAPVEQQMAFSQPTQSTAPVSSIGVSDLQPAAGGTEVMVAPVQEKKMVMAAPAPVNAWTSKPREMTGFGEKPVAQGSQYIWPVSSRDVASSFGDKGKGKVSDGISIAADEGEPVWAAADGEVVYADSKMQGYGKMVIVKHGGGKTTTYAHLARYGVEKYDRVKQGDILGYVGSTGSVSKPQLYFSMRDGTKAVDPQKYLDHKVAGL
ncbi:MAG: M23 family metallopeptidase [Alphaproteobacteria bacterium]|nr:M23 family metallopeptidase [Alphaproteobacteria bacterium]